MYMCMYMYMCVYAFHILVVFAMGGLVVSVVVRGRVIT